MCVTHNPRPLIFIWLCQYVHTFSTSLEWKTYSNYLLDCVETVDSYLIHITQVLFRTLLFFSRFFAFCFEWFLCNKVLFLSFDMEILERKFLVIFFGACECVHVWLMQVQCFHFFFIHFHSFATRSHVVLKLNQPMLFVTSTPFHASVFKSCFVKAHTVYIVKYWAGTFSCLLAPWLKIEKN